MMSSNILARINKSKKVLVTTHINADTDAVSSELAMARYLKAKQKNIIIVNDEKVPKLLSFLPGAKSIRKYKEGIKTDFDLVIVVDCGELRRVGRVQEIIKGKDIINIDHHASNTKFGKYNLVLDDASSAAEVVYGLIKKDKFNMDDKTAMYLYSGIMTDTGSFRYENTSSKTHRIVAELMKHKFSAYKLYQKFYETVPLRDMKLFLKLMTRLEIFFKGKVLCLQLFKKDVSKFSDEFDLRDHIFRYLRCVKEAEVIVIFTERTKDITRCNLRSMNKVDVGKVASRFIGGGHKRASGCTIKKNMKTAKVIMLKEIGKLV